MDWLCAFHRDRGLDFQAGTHSEDAEDITISEVVEHDGYHTSQVATTKLSRTNLKNWLEPGCHSGIGESYTPRMRLVWVTLLNDLSPWQFDIRESDLQRISTGFGIEVAYRYCDSFATGLAAFGDGPADKSRVASYCIFMPDLFKLAWCWDRRSGLVQGICCGDSWLISALQSILDYQDIRESNPMVPAITAVVTLGHLLDRDLHSLNNNIAMVENRIGFHGWQKTSTGIAQGDYAVLSARVSGINTSLAGLQRISSFIKEGLAFIQKSRDADSRDTPAKDPPCASQRGIVQDSKGGTHTILQHRLRMQDIQIEFLLRRTKTQLTAVRALA